MIATAIPFAIIIATLVLTAVTWRAISYTEHAYGAKTLPAPTDVLVLRVDAPLSRSKTAPPQPTGGAFASADRGHMAVATLPLTSDITATLQRLRRARLLGDHDEARVAERRLNWLLERISAKGSR